MREGRDSVEMRAIERLDAVVMRGLDRDPAKRFETAQEMVAALDGCVPPASAAVVARWLEESAGPALARRAAALAAMHQRASVSSSKRRRAWVFLGAGVLSSAAISMALVPWRSFGAVRSSVSIAHPELVTPSDPVGSSLPRAPQNMETNTASSNAPHSPIVNETVAPAPAGTGRNETNATLPSKRAPVPAHSSDCNPPFTWDSQGKKHYKRNCL